MRVIRGCSFGVLTACLVLAGVLASGTAVAAGPSGPFDPALAPHRRGLAELYEPVLRGPVNPSATFLGRRETKCRRLASRNMRMVAQKVLDIRWRCGLLKAFGFVHSAVDCTGDPPMLGGQGMSDCQGCRDYPNWRARRFEKRLARVTRYRRNLVDQCSQYFTPESLGIDDLCEPASNDWADVSWCSGMRGWAAANEIFPMTYDVGGGVLSGGERACRLESVRWARQAFVDTSKERTQCFTRMAEGKTPEKENPPVCIGGANGGVRCYSQSDCPNGVCQPYHNCMATLAWPGRMGTTGSNAEPYFTSRGRCNGGGREGLPCRKLKSGLCSGGSNVGAMCSIPKLGQTQEILDVCISSSGGVCSAICIGGPNDGGSCTSDLACSGDGKPHTCGIIWEPIDCPGLDSAGKDARCKPFSRIRNGRDTFRYSRDRRIMHGFWDLYYWLHQACGEKPNYDVKLDMRDLGFESQVPGGDPTGGSFTVSDLFNKLADSVLERSTEIISLTFMNDNPCTRASQCGSGLCENSGSCSDDDQCLGTSVCTMEPCRKGLECASGVCEDGLCASSDGGSRGGICKGDGGCLSGVCTDYGQVSIKNYSDKWGKCQRSCQGTCYIVTDLVSDGVADQTNQPGGFCGDGIVQWDLGCADAIASGDFPGSILSCEECDDGNRYSCDGCDRDCTNTYDRDCVGGSNDGSSCLFDSDCSGGSCSQTDRPNVNNGSACGIVEVCDDGLVAECDPWVHCAGDTTAGCDKAVVCACSSDADCLGGKGNCESGVCQPCLPLTLREHVANENWDTVPWQHLCLDGLPLSESPLHGGYVSAMFLEVSHCDNAWCCDDSGCDDTQCTDCLDGNCTSNVQCDNIACDALVGVSRGCGNANLVPATEAKVPSDPNWPFSGTSQRYTQPSYEECDYTTSNSDTAHNACRTNCKAYSCGDGILDDDICSGGPNNGGVCLNGDSDCPALVCPAVGFCSGGDDDGDECTDDADCTGTDASCADNPAHGLCIGGGNDGVECTRDDDCPGGACGAGDLCIGGDNDGVECTDHADCTATYCADNPAHGLCIGGDSDGVECTRDDDCPGGGACGGADCTDLDAGTCVDIEECDDGNWLDEPDGDDDSCDSNCTLPACGNGVVGIAGNGQSEACDDGNTADGDYCSANCMVISGWCGDGDIQTNEQCDDGGSCVGGDDDGDECTDDADCTGGGTCEPQPGDGCTASCADPVCGDGDLN
ncbi:MAG: hypothetical protein VCA74_00350, partial [Deltaproteobacteria bacterium]